MITKCIGDTVLPVSPPVLQFAEEWPLAVPADAHRRQHRRRLTTSQQAGATTPSGLRQAIERDARLAMSRAMLQHALRRRQAFWEDLAIAHFSAFLHAARDFADPVLTGRCSVYSLGSGAHMHEAHVYPEVAHTTRAGRLEIGMSAGGACPVCRFKFSAPPVIFQIALGYMPTPGAPLTPTAFLWHKIITRYVPLDEAIWKAAHSVRVFAEAGLDDHDVVTQNQQDAKDAENRRTELHRAANGQLKKKWIDLHRGTSQLTPSPSRATPGGAHASGLFGAVSQQARTRTAM